MILCLLSYLCRDSIMQNVTIDLRHNDAHVMHQHIRSKSFYMALATQGFVLHV